VPEFLLYAGIAGLLVALVAGPLGSFIVWQRLAYFGDTLAHSALLGIAFGLMSGANMTLAITLSCCLVAVALVYLSERSLLSSDAVLGIISHSALALGLVLISLSDNARVDLSAFLFGDLLGVDRVDLIGIGLTTAICMGLMIGFWNRLISTTVHPELAQVEGLPTRWMKLLLTLMIAVVVAAAMKVVGVLLITALLIIPASTAGQFARSPESMAMLASLLAGAAVVAGLAMSWTLDTPAGPSVVVASGALFMFVHATRRISRAFACRGAK
jgi:zinc transport system permease protein